MQKTSDRLILTGSDLTKIFNALTISIFLNCQGFNFVLRSIFPSNSFLSLSSIFIICFIFFLLGIRKVKVGLIYYLIPVAVLFYFLLTNLLFPGKSVDSLVQILTYTILPFILVQLEFDFSNVVKWSIFITFPAILFSGSIFSHSYYGGITMGVSYAFMPAVIFSLCYIFYYFRNEKIRFIKWLLLLLSFVEIYFLYEILFFGSRGPFLCILTFLIVLSMFKIDHDTGRYRCRRRWLFVIIVFLILILFIFGDLLLSWLNDFLSSRGISIKFISKTYTLNLDENISNGRGPIYLSSWKGFLKSPIFGNGIDMFYFNTGYQYPHNLFLQSLYDGGLILFLLIFVPCIIYSIRILRTRNYNQLMVWIVLFCISVPGAFFSGDLWEKYTFWFFLAYCVSRGNGLPRLSKNHSIV